MQLTHYTSKFESKQFPVILICDNVTSATNIGSIIRTADAFGVAKVYFCGQQIEFNKKAARASRAAEKIVDYELNTDIIALTENLKAQGYFMLSLEITTDSLPLHKLDFRDKEHIVIILGDENYGIRDSVLMQSDAIGHIEMYGQNSSMNVVQAASIALYEITSQLM